MGEVQQRRGLLSQWSVKQVHHNQRVYLARNPFPCLWQCLQHSAPAFTESRACVLLLNAPLPTLPPLICRRWGRGRPHARELLSLSYAGLHWHAHQRMASMITARGFGHIPVSVWDTPNELSLLRVCRVPITAMLDPPLGTGHVPLGTQNNVTLVLQAGLSLFVQLGSVGHWMGCRARIRDLEFSIHFWLTSVGLHTPRWNPGELLKH